MTSTIPYLGEDQWKSLNSVIIQIAKETNAEKIMCFGTRTTHNVVWSSFLTDADEVRTVECDLIILTREKEKGKSNGVSEKVSKYNTSSLKFTVLVHFIEAVNEELRRGNYFFASILQKGVLLFDNQSTSLKIPRQVVPSVTDIEKCWKRHYGLAFNFFKGGTHALSQGWNDQAMFMLHQSVEHTCIALIKIYWGYKATTHSLAKLLSMIENFSLHSITTFPRTTKNEIRTFNLLEKAYSHSRYDEEYTISTQTVDALKEEVEEFLELGQALFVKKTKLGTASVDKLAVPSFESIGIDTFARLVLKQGDRETVEVRSDYGSEKSIIVKEEGKRLWITTGNLQSDKIYDATVYVTYKTLSGVVAHHAESVKSEGAIETQWLGIVNNSRASIELDVDVLTLDVTVNKHGSVILSGSADEAKMFNNRSGEIDAKNLKTSSAKVVTKGAGNVFVHVEEELHAELRGSGNLQVTGSPRIKTMITSGSGTVMINGKTTSYDKKESQES